jgi:uncharacterized protein YecE (DUF72 family)
VPLLVGTSGWQYRHWRGLLYPPGVPQRSWLEHYAERFRTVEVNATFYRLPSDATMDAWAARVPGDFTMAVKASRFLTHVRRLRDPEEPVQRFVRLARRLGPHLGPILVQLPPDMRLDTGRLAGVLEAFPADLRVAVEPRHRSWFVPEVFELLSAHDAALCMADRPGWRPEPVRTASWGYLRLHEGRASPRPCYGRAAIDSWARRLAELFSRDETVYAYLNNDPRGCAVRDARVLALRAARAGLDPSRVPPASETPVDRG